MVELSRDRNIWQDAWEARTGLVGGNGCDVNARAVNYRQNKVHRRKRSDTKPASATSSADIIG